MKFQLVPTKYKKLLSGIKKISIVANILIVIFLTILSFTSNWQTVMCFSIGLLGFFFPFMLLNCYHDKICGYTVEFTDSKILVYDKHNKIKRTVLYKDITAFSVEDVEGYFYGFGEKPTHKYICLYLNGNNQMPLVSYAKLFTNNDFFMVNYDDDAYNVFLANFTNATKR